MRLLGVLLILGLLTGCDGMARSVNKTIYPAQSQRLEQSRTPEGTRPCAQQLPPQC